MGAYGKIAQAAAARLINLKKPPAADTGMPNAGAMAPAVSRVAPAAPSKSPKTRPVGQDAQMIKTRQEYEDIPEAGMSRGGRGVLRKKKSSDF